MKHYLKILLFCGALFLVPVLTVLGGHAATSYYENRALAAFPFWASTMLSGVPGTAITAIVLSLILREKKDEAADEEA